LRDPKAPETSPPSLVDTHCHLDLGAFDADRQSVLDRAARAGVGRIVVPGLNHGSALRILDLTQAHENVFAAVGIHPTEADGENLAGAADWPELADRPKVVAVGEIGLDYYWVADQNARAVQRALLQQQLELARQCHLPAILHLREEGDAVGGPCSQDMLDLLRDWTRTLRNAGDTLASRPGVLHSFSSSLEVASEAIDLGFFIGLTGPVTFPKADARRDVVRNLPLDRILVETDAPFLAPVPHRGHRNEPAFVTHIADKIARIQSRPVRDVITVTSENAARLFDWGVSV
jgi:TatD DNase family protein